MEDILDKVKPIFQKYDEGEGHVSVDKAKKIIEELEESSDESYKTIFKGMNFPGNKVHAQEIAYWIDAKNKGTGHLAMVPIFGYRSLEKAKEWMEKVGFEVSSSGLEQNIELSLGANVSELVNKETYAGIQLNIGGKQPEILQDLGIPQGFAIVVKLKCNDPYSATSKIEDLINSSKELLINMIPPQIAEIIEKIEIKCSTLSNDYVAVSFQFPNDHITEIAKQQKKLVSSFMGDSENQFQIDLELATSLNLKKLQEEKEKAMSDLILNQDQALKFLLKFIVPGAFASNAKKLGSIFLEKFLANKVNKYKKTINILTPLFLLQSAALELNFLSFADFIKKGEDSEILEDLLDFGLKKTPKEFKEDMNDEFQIKETLDGAIEGMPLVSELLNFFKESVCLDFELILEIGIAKLHIFAKSEGLKEWFEYIMKEEQSD